MSLNKFVLVFLIAHSVHGLAKSLNCPDTLDGHPLIEPVIYDGPPSLRANEIPEVGGWHDLSSPWTKQGYFLVCEYVGARKTLTFRIPRSVKACFIDHVVPDVRFNVACQ